VDGACYNAGQSCCGIERIFVHEKHYDQFLGKATELFNAYALGDPLDASTSMGPMALPSAPSALDAVVKDAVAKGARALTGQAGITSGPSGKGRFFTPTLVADCNSSMQIMVEEAFGPIVGVEKVSSDEEAVAKMNASKYGLTAAVFTSDKDRALRLGSQLSAGTVFMNRCDALDPYLPWTGLRDTGKGASLSKYGFRALTKLKSVRCLWGGIEGWDCWLTRVVVVCSGTSAFREEVKPLRRERRLCAYSSDHVQKNTKAEALPPRIARFSYA
jgi:acyl-CoA reductase-like NAD-dependent aldehyde dehydrogenase